MNHLETDPSPEQTCLFVRLNSEYATTIRDYAKEMGLAWRPFCKAALEDFMNLPIEAIKRRTKAQKGSYDERPPLVVATAWEPNKAAKRRRGLGI